MKKILHVISSPMGDASFSIKLGNAIVEKLQAVYSDSSVQALNLVKEQLPHLEQAHVASFFTPVESRTHDQQTITRYSDEGIEALTGADIIVIGAPVYNFNIHSSLKAWIDQVVRAGVTFKYDENGPEGLLKDKKVYLAIASGGVYSEGPMKAIDFVAPYLKTILGFIGLTDITVFRVEGTAVPELKDHALENGINSIHLN